VNDAPRPLKRAATPADDAGVTVDETDELYRARIEAAARASRRLREREDEAPIPARADAPSEQPRARAALWKMAIVAALAIAAAARLGRRAEERATAPDASTAVERP
jgi:hypothetical protein